MENVQTKRHKTKRYKTKRHKTKKHKTKRHKTKRYKKEHIIKSITPETDIILSININNNLKNEKKSIFNKSMSKKSIIMKSFSPNINKQIVSLMSIPVSNIFKCDNLLEINIKNKCFKYDSMKVKMKLLKNLQSSKHLDCNQFIAPKQYNSNCWFNTMFVTFFFSDKGRKFFRFFRQLMILGEKINGEKIPKELAEIFFILNKIIEACYNQKENANKKLIYNFNTNYFIENIYKILLKQNIKVFKKNESGNPIEYYKNIVKYLNYNVINIINIDIDKISNNIIQDEINKISTNFPEILIIEILDNNSKKIKNKSINLNLIDNNNISNNYVLDAAILRDKDKQHFCSLLTCNKEELSFDGASYSRLNKFKWKQYLNTNKNWGFQGHTLKWNFMSAYQMLFYYKI